MTTIRCPYCRRIAQLVKGDVAVPRHKHLWSHRFWFCAPCDASVKAHPDGHPMGRMATPRIRYLRAQAHLAFDALWKDPRRAGFIIKNEADLVVTRQKLRTRCYTWLADILLMTHQEAHFGMMTDEPLLLAVAEMCRAADPADIRARYRATSSRATTQHFRRTG